MAFHEQLVSKVCTASCNVVDVDLSAATPLACLPQGVMRLVIGFSLEAKRKKAVIPKTRFGHQVQHLQPSTRNLKCKKS